MKLPRGVDLTALVSRTGSPVRFVLFYGPDTGAGAEQARALVRAVAGAEDDPFRTVEFPASSLKEVPSRLVDEAASISFGGRRVVRVRDASDALAGEAVEALLADSNCQALVVMEAGDLPAKSVLRKLAEAAPAAVAVGCYHDEGGDLARVVKESLQGHGLTASGDALAYLVERLGSDRLVSRSELDKLALYMGMPDGANGRQVMLEDAMASIGDTALVSMDDAISAAATGDRAGLDRALERCWLDGTAPIALVRSALRHFQRLHLLAGMVAAGRQPMAAIESLRPPPFRREADRLARQVARWRPAKVQAALARLTEAEIRCKTTGMPEEAIAARALAEIAAL